MKNRDYTRASFGSAALLVPVMVLLLSAPVAFGSGGQDGDWELGLFAGYGWPDDYVRQGELLPLHPEDDLLYGARLGYFFTPGWSIEASYQMLSTSTCFGGVDPDVDMDMESARLNMLYNFKPGESFRPFLTFGAGLETTDVSSLLNEDDFGYNVGGGLRWFLGETFGLRLDARYVYVDVGGTVDDAQSNIETGFGLLWAFGGGEPPDEDGDGVPDRRDRCPGTPRGAIVDEEGCPLDGDGDGVFDGIDKCPDTPSGYAVDADGCSRDSDGDGVNDALDKCPDTPRGATVDGAGCPSDSDGDGVFDGIDKCPDTPKGAKVDSGGCPKDSDGDGVYDGIDKCPGTPKGATVDSSGCPKDSDGDGVFDGIDQCPGTRAGAQVNSVGCEVLFEEGRDTLVLQDINFEFDSFELTAESKKILDSVSESLRHFEDARVEVAGHTDSRGSESYNLKLSQSRADAVRSYLISNGIGEGRLVAKGYGESASIADNSTEEGRAENRRVELKKLD
jgi:outer membrane protein OmpA-like peptidoglycan-associated protein